MRKIKFKLIVVFAVAAMLGSSCASSNSYKGSAIDRTGTNGATNGNGKVPSL